MFERFYASHFREIFGAEPEPADGLGPDSVEDRLDQRGLQIPEALFAYYSIAGYHWVNKKQNRLRPIEELDWYMDWLVFMDDDQGLVSWGIHRQDLNSRDPAVWQGILGEEIDWFQENLTLSKFLIEMCREAV